MTLRHLTPLLLSLLPTLTLAAAPPHTLPLWPDLDPALKEKQTTDDRGTPDNPNRFVRDIAYPTLTLHLPERAKSPTPAVIICPGGGYAGVAVDKEGHAIAQWLNSLGIAGLVLQYRMPQPDLTKDATPLPLQDAREAIRLARAHARDWNLDPAKVGIIGFSAGGHLASSVLTLPGDDPDTHPNFGILLYPVISFQDGVAHTGSKTRLLGKTPDPTLLERYSTERQVTPKTPPVFLIHTQDDNVSCRNSILFFEACRAQKVPAELHLFPKGGHGYGLGPKDSPVSQWPTLCATWLHHLKVLD